MISDNVKKRLAELPSNPGVYLMKDGQDKVIYIGKARSLRSRVRSYFNSDTNKTHRAALLLQPIVRDIDWHITDSEMEALVLEANLIQKHKPKYNVRQKDDKHYPYIMITTREPFPRVIVVRKVKKDGNRYFGPFTNVRGMRAFIKQIPKLFKIRDCNLKLPSQTVERACLNYQIGRCDAPCVDKCTQEEYRVQVDQLIRFMEGKRKDIIRELENQMLVKSEELNFEEAAKIRDRVSAMKSILERQKMDLSDSKASMDIIGVARDHNQGCAVISMVREGLLIDRKYFPLDCPDDTELGELTISFMMSYYKDSADLPNEVITANAPDDENDLKLLSDFLTEQKGRKVVIKIPQRGEKNSMLNLTTKNAEMLLVEQMARSKSYSDIEESIFELQKILSLPVAPHRIEGFDISHLGGTLTVASMVSFMDGRPDKKEYRHFRIKTVSGIDDFASMNEVVGRRYTRLVDENKPLPDLILIDGGKGQVSSAMKIIRELGLTKIPLIGLAKREEEIILPGEKESIILSRRSSALKLIQRVRNESHRFAITFQRESRKKMLKVEWLDIPGIGADSRKKILKLFKTPQEVLEADDKVLLSLLGKMRAGILVEALRLLQANK